MGSTTCKDEESVRYRIVVQGELEERWSDWFDGFTVTLEGENQSVLLGDVPDQCALHGVLSKIRDLCLPILLVEILDDEKV